MPIFYLHLCNGTGYTEDEEGSDLPSLDTARARAIAGLRDIMAADMQRGELNLGSFIEIEDGAHRHLMTVPFADAVIVSDVKGRGRE